MNLPDREEGRGEEKAGKEERVREGVQGEGIGSGRGRWG